MKSVTQLKSLGDIRTTVSTHARSVPRQKGSNYLEVYLLDKEKQRLEMELAMLDKRRHRIEERLREIRQAVDKLLQTRKQDDGASPQGVQGATPGGSQPPSENHPTTRRWRRMTVGY
jgi:hypothetical protein